jgi:hypothetical protein
LGETAAEWIVHGFTETDYLATFADNPSDIYGVSSIDKAMVNAYKQTRKFLMAMYGMTELEANTFITQGIDFGMTQLVDGNWGVHGIIPKTIFEVEGGVEEGGVEEGGEESNATEPPSKELDGGGDAGVGSRHISFAFAVMIMVGWMALLV